MDTRSWQSFLSSVNSALNELLRPSAAGGDTAPFYRSLWPRPARPLHAAQDDDLWVLGPNGVHRHGQDDAAAVIGVEACMERVADDMVVQLRNPNPQTMSLDMRGAMRD